jgi:hypothetical protein
MNTMELCTTEPVVMVVPWHDPIVDAVGYDVRSLYVELYWLNVLGPTATWLVRRLVTGLDQYPLGYELDLGETAGALGLAYTSGTSNPFMRSMNRCVMFGVAQPVDGALAVRRRVPPVAQRHLQRMPPHLQASHADWLRHRAATSLSEIERARELAAAMVRSGDDRDVVERQLMSLGVSPLVAAEVGSGTA